MEQAVHPNILTPAPRQAIPRPAAAPLPADALPGAAAVHVWNARSALADMAVEGLNRDPAAHCRALTGVQNDLGAAMIAPVGAAARAGLRRLWAETGALRSRLPGLTPEERTGAYIVAEMRVAALLLADIDAGGPRHD